MYLNFKDSLRHGELFRRQAAEKERESRERGPEPGRPCCLLLARLTDLACSADGPRPYR